MIGKVLIFSAGMLVGAGAILAANFNSQTNDAATVLPPEREAAPDAVATVVQHDSETVPTALDSDAAVPSQGVSGELLRDLVARITQAEHRITELELALADVETPFPAADPAPSSDTSSEELLIAGFDPFTVEEISAVRNQVQLERLELRDRAAREGWLNSDRFRQAVRELSRDGKLRETLGDEAYEKLLLAEGRNNRVRVDSVIANSAADGAGIKSGDILLRYADAKILTFRDLRGATTDGERDEPVSVRLRRDGEIIDLVVPRGPLGVTISGTTGD